MKRMKRLHYLRQVTEVTRYRLQEALNAPDCLLVLQIPITDVMSSKHRYPFKCACGAISNRQPKDIIAGVKKCRVCASKERFITDGYKMIAGAIAYHTGNKRVSVHWEKLRHVCQGAKQRCTNSKVQGYANYGGRGISFGFASASAMAHWIASHIGYPPPGMSLDRVDNNKGYEAGNLRWATREVQGQNKRAYKRGEIGTRIRKLQDMGSPFHYETLRGFIREGMTDEQILSRKKTACGRPRLRHNELRATE